jgi:uncharacterized protein (TIGR00645 family)
MHFTAAAFLLPSPATILLLKGQQMIKFISSLMLATRWILAPIYLGLSITLFMVAIKFFIEVVHVFPTIFEISEADLVLFVLALIDLALVGSLVVMVMLSGFENFISRFEKDDNLGWLNKMDASTLKVKVAISIVAISAIHLLQVFMNAEQISNDKLMWFVIIHLTFVVSAFILAYMDTFGKEKV